MSTQLERPINIPHQPHSRLYRLTVAQGLTLLFTQATDVLAQQKPPMTMSLPVVANKASAPGEIAGQVIDEKRAPMISAGVRVLKEGQKVASVVSDNNGNYQVKMLAAGWYTVEVYYPGYDTMVTTGVLVDEGQKTSLDNYLTAARGTAEASIVRLWTPEQYQKAREKMGGVSSGRPTGTLYTIDGVQVTGSEQPSTHLRKRRWWRRKRH